ncbi:MAG TPA: histidine triad nucleotide-binding protein [Anaerolineaceae bacterium]|nr:histidine triad nucleotide-binding protein [Anaerolineaceae bacterium]
MKDPNCIFCKIITGKSPAQILYQDDLSTAFWDAHPIAPVHILVVPNDHIDSLNSIQNNHESTLGHLILIAHTLAKQHGIHLSGYRLVINTGPDAGQSVNHLHLHLIGGRRMPFRFE